MKQCSVELTRLQSVKRTIHLPITSMLNTTQHCGQRSPPFTDCDPQPFRDLENTANAGRLSADQKLDLKSRPPQTMKLLHSEFQTLQASSLQQRITVVRAPALIHCLVQPLVSDSKFQYPNQDQQTPYEQLTSLQLHVLLKFSVCLFVCECLLKLVTNSVPHRLPLMIHCEAT